MSQWGKPFILQSQAQRLARSPGRPRGERGATALSKGRPPERLGAGPTGGRSTPSASTERGPACLGEVPPRLRPAGRPQRGARGRAGGAPARRSWGAERRSAREQPRPRQGASSAARRRSAGRKSPAAEPPPAPEQRRARGERRPRNAAPGQHRGRRAAGARAAADGGHAPGRERGAGGRRGGGDAGPRLLLAVPLLAVGLARAAR